MNKKWSLLFIIGLALIFLMAACSSSTSEPATAPTNESAGTEQTQQETASPEPAGEDITVGLLLPITGPNAPDGIDMQNAAEMAVEEINANGGVLGGRMLKVVVEDDACDPQMATAAANKLVANKVTAVVGGYCSGSTLPATGVFHNANLPMIISAANSAQIAEQGFPNIFMVNGMVPDQAKKGIDYFMKNGATNIALIHDNTAYSRDMADFAKQFLEEAGGTVVAFEAINPEEKDFGAIMTKMKSLSPDGIYFTGYYAAGGLMLRQFVQKDVGGLFMAGDGSFHQTIIDTAGAENAEGLLITATPTAEFLPGAESFVEQYEAKFNQPPGPFSALTHNAMNLLADAIERAGSTDSQAIIDALKATKDFEALGMTINFNEDGSLASNTFGVLIVRNGKFTLID